MAQAKGVAAIVQELKEMLVTYARQETVDPLKNLGRYVAFGFGGSILMGIGGVLFVVAILRLLQEETGQVFENNLSWAPYFLTVMVIALLIAVLGAMIKRARDANLRRSNR